MISALIVSMWNSRMKQQLQNTPNSQYIHLYYMMNGWEARQPIDTIQLRVARTSSRTKSERSTNDNVLANVKQEGSINNNIESIFYSSSNL
jgi:hypothetical protein